jgi:alpha-tubulin suppressor-like RCC1 family protein
MRKAVRLHLLMMIAVFLPAMLGMANDSWAATPRVAAGGNHTVALRSDGSLWAWGDNAFGQVGDGSVIARNTPVRIGTDITWTAVAAGFYHTVALKADGTLWSWGDDTKGQLGDGSPAASQPAPVRVGTETNWAAVAAGDFHTLALKTDGSLWGWGDNTAGQVGDGSVVPNTRSVPVRIGIATDWLAIAAGGSHSAALKTDHTLWAWGANNAGQLGNGTNIAAVAPLQIVLPSPFVNTDWVAVAAGRSHTGGVKADGTLLTWGNNTFGQLGNGTTNGATLDSDVPVQEAGKATTWAAAAAGDGHTVGRQGNGTIWSWGDNAFGQLGDGSLVARNAPIKVGADTDWAAAAAGSGHSTALKADGTIWSWGDNTFGQLGDGTSIARNAPVLVAQARFLPRGDLDQNGRVDIADALRALRIAVQLVQPTADDVITGDVASPNGSIDLADALGILRKAVGLVTF